MTPRPETATLGGDTGNPLVISRIITGLWQLAGGHDEHVDVGACADTIRAFVAAGLSTFDMADHYGAAEEVIGAYHGAADPITALTKWCPKPDVIGAEACAAAVELALIRMRVTSLDVLQYHAWRYDKPSYLDNLYHLSLLQKAGKIKHLGVTNMDLAHLKMLHSSGYRIASNQVSMSVLDRRAETGGLAAWCAEHKVGLLAYGTLLGGFVSEKWLGAEEPMSPSNWSLAKYKRFIDSAGGWSAFQTLLSALHAVASKHRVSIAAVATRFVLDIPGVAAVIVGSRLSPASVGYISSNLEAFTFTLDDDDGAIIAEAQVGLCDIPGDCGDEYRYPPFLTATGDLRQHLAEDESQLAEVERVIAAGGRIEKSSGSPYEPIAGYCRGVRIGNQFEIAGTTTRIHPSGTGVIGGASAEDQATNIFDIITGAIASLGASVGDITRTRIFLHQVDDWRGVATVQGRTMRRYGIRPVNTMVGGSTLIGQDILVEVEAEGVVRSGEGPLLRL